MKKHLFLLASLALGMAACTNDNLSLDDQTSGETPDTQTTETSPLLHASLSATPGDQSRVTPTLSTRDGESVSTPGSLTLIAKVENPSKELIPNFGKEENGRYMSATCVYYDAKTDTYYATYHMQGNNYNTQLDKDVAGCIESFTIDDEGVHLQTLYRSADPSKLDFDFNHLYFDTPDDHQGVTIDDFQDRIVAVGHRVVPTSQPANKTHRQ